MYLDMSGRKEPTLNLTKTEAIELVQKIVQQLPGEFKNMPTNVGAFSCHITRHDYYTKMDKLVISID